MNQPYIAPICLSEELVKANEWTKRKLFVIPTPTIVATILQEGKEQDELKRQIEGDDRSDPCQICGSSLIGNNGEIDFYLTQLIRAVAFLELTYMNLK